MVQVDEKERIRNAYYLQERSIREIARCMRHSRKTVRKAILDSSPPVYKRTHPRPCPVIDPVREIIDKWIEEDSGRPRKQRHTAHRIYERLRDEHGFGGSEPTVRRYVRSVRKRSVEQYVPLSFEPGQDAQADFGEARAVLDGEEIAVHLFCLQLAYSRRRFVMALPCEKQEAFLEAHARAFDFFGGVPRRISYDNLTTATHRAIRGDKRREIDSFVAFRSHYLFASHFCNPSEAHEKGQVENLVGYARRNWFVPVPRFVDLEDLNAYLLAKCLADDGRVIFGMRRSIGEMFDDEQEKLLPLPARRYDCFRLQSVRANKMGIVHFESNSYSVPGEFSRADLFVKAYFDRVEICDVGRVIACHRRLYGRGEESLKPEHYLQALRMKPGAVEYARPVKQSEFAPVYFRFLARLKELMPESAARRGLVRVLELTASYPEGMVAEAMELALIYGSCDSDAVKNLLVQMSGEDVAVGGTCIPQRLADVRVDVRDVGSFDQLLCEVGL